jgi:exonuclease SbcD
VLARPIFLSPFELGLPIQVIALPWVSRAGLMASTDASMEEAIITIEGHLTSLVNQWLEKADPALPMILTAHASIEGAKYSTERTVMLGADLVLPGSLVRDPRLDYVALGHIHKSQDLNENAHPPVIYPGSIERVDFGEAGDEKYFVIADIEKGKTDVHWRRLENIRPFIDRRITLESPENVTGVLTSALPAAEELTGAIVRLTVDYSREWDDLIDEPALRRYAESAFEFHLVKRPQIVTRIRLSADQAMTNLGPLELLDQYWRTGNIDPGEAEILQKLAGEIMVEE